MESCVMTTHARCRLDFLENRNVDQVEAALFAIGHDGENGRFCGLARAACYHLRAQPWTRAASSDLIPET